MQTRRDVFQAIADPTRRDIINLIAYQSMNLNSIAENFDVSRPAISQHIKILIECGLVTIKKQGRERIAEATLSPLSTVTDWIEPFRRRLEERYTALDDVLEEMKARKKRIKK
ncbi:MAG TPA: metalloregulator ArsR/SmtB family transcription factor [Cyclobacteriaceae bacterium]|nr:metalloregulator ArsR/SmtB family transcription factor [Cyclobacteriaceae bacterium]